MRLVKNASVFSNGVAVRREICAAMEIIDDLHIKETGREAEFTSICDGIHSVKYSLHYNGLAVDLRIWFLADPMGFAEELQQVLGPQYQVRLEKYHIHCEFQPTRTEP